MCGQDQPQEANDARQSATRSRAQRKSRCPPSCTCRLRPARRERTVRSLSNMFQRFISSALWVSVPVFSDTSKSRVQKTAMKNLETHSVVTAMSHATVYGILVRSSNSTTKSRTSWAHFTLDLSARALHDPPTVAGSAGDMKGAFSNMLRTLAASWSPTSSPDLSTSMPGRCPHLGHSWGRRQRTSASGGYKRRNVKRCRSFPFRSVIGKMYSAVTCNGPSKELSTAFFDNWTW